MNRKKKLFITSKFITSGRHIVGYICVSNNHLKMHFPLRPAFTSSRLRLKEKNDHPIVTFLYFPFSAPLENHKDFHFFSGKYRIYRRSTRVSDLDENACNHRKLVFDQIERIDCLLCCLGTQIELGIKWDFLHLLSQMGDWLASGYLKSVQTGKVKTPYHDQIQLPSLFNRNDEILIQISMSTHHSHTSKLLRAKERGETLKTIHPPSWLKCVEFESHFDY